MPENPYKSDHIRDKVVKNLSEILEESGCCSQAEFGEKILGIKDNPSFTNDIFKGRKKLSRKKALAIVNHFPWLRTQWILGEDDYKTEAEKNLSQFKTDYSSIKMRGYAFLMLAELCGFNIYIPKTTDAESLVKSIHEGYLIQHGSDVVGHIPLEKLNLLSLDIQELTEQRIRSFLRESEA